MDKIIIAIGGGELREKQTSEIDRQISGLVKKKCEGRRPTALFVGTASHDSMPYYNSFHKTYTGLFGLKTDCALTVYGEMNYEKIEGKFRKADMIYVGGGDTLFMLDSWEKSGIKKLILDAYDRGVIICGLSAGAIFWYDEMFTDSAGAEYEFKKASERSGAFLMKRRKKEKHQSQTLLRKCLRLRRLCVPSMTLLYGLVFGLSTRFCIICVAKFLHFV